MLRIKLTSVIVDDQEKAHRFYTQILGFQTKRDIPMGGARWLTLVSLADPDGAELLLEPMGFEPARVYQKALFDAGIPLTAFAVDDVQAEYETLKNAASSSGENRAPNSVRPPFRSRIHAEISFRFFSRLRSNSKNDRS